jgi:hypothetical protein
VRLMLRLVGGVIGFRFVPCSGVGVEELIWLRPYVGVVYLWLRPVLINGLCFFGGWWLVNCVVFWCFGVFALFCCCTIGCGCYRLLAAL